MRRATATTSAIHLGSGGAAFTCALGIPTMRASAAMHRHATSGWPAGDGPGVAQETAAAGPAPATDLTSIDFEMFRGRLRLSGTDTSRAMKRRTRAAPLRAQRPARSRPPCNPLQATPLGV